MKLLEFFYFPACWTLLRTQTLRVWNAQARPELAPAEYAAQLLGELDRPIGETLKLAELTIPARIGERGQLQLDLRNEGKFVEYLRDQTVTLSLKRDGVSQPPSVRVPRKASDATSDP